MAFTLAYGEFLWRAAAPGVDFYHYWALIKVKRVLAKDIGSPYLRQDQYTRCLKAYAAKSSSPLLKEANKIRSKLDATGTPLQYAIFTILPLNYNVAIFLFRITQALVFIGAIILLGTHYKTSILPSLSFAFLLIVVYEPISQDFWMGNLNAIQFGILTTLALLAKRIHSPPPSGNHFTLGVVFMCGFIFLAMLKPNFVLVSLIMMAFLWRNIGTRQFMKTTIFGGAFTILLAAIPCFLFESLWIWSDWWSELQRFVNDRLNFLYPITSGNFATPLMLSKAFNIKSEYCSLIMGAFITASLIIAIGTPFASKRRNAMGNIRDILSSILQSPFLCISIGLIITMAMSPLLWMHYLVILLLPALWMILEKKLGETVGILGTISIVMASGLLLRILKLHSDRWIALAPYMFGLAWIPLWAGIIVIIFQKSTYIVKSNEH